MAMMDRLPDEQREVVALILIEGFGYRAMFLLMACYAALAFVAVLRVPRGAGEADTGADASAEGSLG